MYNSHPNCANIALPLNMTELMIPYTIENQSVLRNFFSIFFFVISFIHCFIGFILFIIIHRNERILRIRIRSILLVVLTMLAVLFHSCIAFLPYFAVPIVAWVVYTSQLLIVALAIAPIPIRLFSFYARYLFSRATAQINIYDNSDEEKSNKPTNQEANNQVTIANNNSIKEESALSIDNHKNNNDLESNYATSDNGSNSHSEGSNHRKERSLSTDVHSYTLPNTGEGTEVVAEESKSQKNAKKRKRNMSPRELMILKFSGSPAAQFTAFAIALIPLILTALINVTTIPSLYPSAECYNSPAPESTFIAAVFYGATFVLFGIIGGCLVRKFPDPFGIATETRIYALYGATVSLLSFILDLTIFHLPFSFSFDYCVSIGLNMMFFTSTGYQIYLAIIEHYSSFSFRNLKHLLIDSIYPSQEIKPFQVIRMGNGIEIRNESMTFDEGDDMRGFMHMLSDPKGNEDFERFLVNEFSASHFKLYLECKKWEATYFDSTDSQRRARAKQIADHFIQPKALFEVHLPNELREEIIEACRNKKEPLLPDLFADTKNEMLVTIYDAYQRYSAKKDSKNPL